MFELYEKNNGVFEIRDRRITSDVINRFLITIDHEPLNDLTIDIDQTIAKGKKRCTKWKKGKRFCVQRIGFLHWKFGREYQ